MKIYFIVYNVFGMGGTVKTTVNTVNYLVRQGYKVEIISLRRTSQKPLFKIDPKVKITPLIDVRRGYLYKENSSFIKKLIKKILLKVPSLIIHKDEDLYKMFSLFSDIKLIKSLVSIRKGIVVTTIPSLNLLSTRLLNKNIIKIGQEHKPYDAHTNRLREKIKKRYNKLDYLTCLTERDYLYYKNINKNTYKIENGTEIDWRKSDLDNKLIISAGRLSEEKGFDMLLKAFSIVIKRYPDWKLKIFGEGKEKGRLEEIILEEALHNNVMLMPKSNCLDEEIYQSSIYALSSRYESFGMVLIEAMALGVPCVSYSCAGPQEIIKHNEDGILVPEGDIQLLAEAMMELMEDIDKRKLLGKVAKKNVQRYSTEEIGKKWINIIENITKK